ncbi:GNAT family N-acetyltransferase [Aeromonas dhakensis]|uniref:GNAT family N-acetyltransferase n=1 Tax=Aeromonas dhakensis TaxID=196024 RepID=UPI001AAF3C18|nr:GNAT family N-acetyltransferase [Aeromonas dhakensis]MBO2899173.1 GNAT family N-acetyltransferase [Aeromonas dhakensis]MBO2994744.1 GNAT family N-acetyltransferase [Aeromonas dhakensis]
MRETSMVFSPFSAVRAEDFLPLLNDETLRKHLIPHPLFDVAGVRDWMAHKLGVDARPGCRVRAIFLDGTLVGWCGIQPDDEGVELAIVLARVGWGSGVAIFNEMMGWARELGHRTILFHLLDTRPPYRSLARRAIWVRKTRLGEHPFTTYCLDVESWSADP